jgi:ABC-type phosphate transport system substrate-binding protein
MTSPGLRIGIVFAALLAVAFASPSAARDAGFKIIVHPENPVEAVSREFLRHAWLKKSTEWSDGETIRPVDLSSRFTVRDQFTQEVIRKSPAQLRNYWNQRIFSGKGAPPPEAGSIDDLIEFVLANPGAVAYLPDDADPGEARVIEVR